MEKDRKREKRGERERERMKMKDQKGRKRQTQEGEEYQVIISSPQELPELWSTIKKTTVSVKQDVAPLQAQEVNILRRKLANFDVRQHEFREKFRKTAPFAYEADVVYARIDRVSIYMYMYT